MNISSASQGCHDFLTHRGQQDPFLGQADQRPLLEQELGKLAQRLAAHENEIAGQFGALVEGMRRNLSEVSAMLQATHAQLETDLAPLAAATPPDESGLRAIETRLDELVRGLSRRTRARLLHSLVPAAPSRRIIPALMAALNQFRRITVEALPEEFILLHPRDPSAAFEPGRSIFDTAVAPELPSLCRSRLLSRLRYRLLRRRLKRQYRLLALPFREMAADTLILRSSLDETTLVKRQEQTYQETLSRLTDLWRAIRYNLDSAVVDLDDMLEVTSHKADEKEKEWEVKRREIGPLVLASFAKSRETLEDVALAHATVLEGTLAEIRQDHKSALRAIREGVDQANSLRGRLRWGYKSMEKSLIRRFGLWGRFLNSIRADIGRRGHRWLQRLLHGWYALRRFLGLKQDIEEPQRRLTDLPLPAEVAEQARELPPIYRRLFSAEPLLSREFLVAREEEFKLMQNALERWRSGRAASVAIVGPEGSGKTSLLNCLENDLDTDIVVSHLHMSTRPRTTAELCRFIGRTFDMPQPPEDIDKLIAGMQTLSRRMIIVEQAHHLLMRAVGGREVLETFFRLIMATRERFLWLVSTRKYAWQRMEYLSDARRYFTYVIPCEFHDEKELKEALLRRERVTGHDVTYCEGEKPPTHIRKLRLSHPLESAAVQQALAEEYFTSLYDISGGNMRAALYFWLQSLSRSDNGRIQVQPIMSLDDSFIRNLDRHYHFILAEVVGHGTLNAAELGEIFRLDENTCQLRLDYLRHIRLLELLTDEQGMETERYEINPVFHKPVTRALLNLNVLY